eukprot:scaffold163449_cov19-Prasinocladus_malaysianus.AAC.1
MRHRRLHPPLALGLPCSVAAASSAHANEHKCFKLLTSSPRTSGRTRYEILVQVVIQVKSTSTARRDDIMVWARIPYEDGKPILV